jgi:hypothetical protein
MAQKATLLDYLHEVEHAESRIARLDLNRKSRTGYSKKDHRGQCLRSRCYGRVNITCQYRCSMVCCRKDQNRLRIESNLWSWSGTVSQIKNCIGHRPFDYRGVLVRTELRAARYSSSDFLSTSIVAPWTEPSVLLIRGPSPSRATFCFLCLTTTKYWFISQRTGNTNVFFGICLKKAGVQWLGN